jgi:hypothetical protein
MILPISKIESCLSPTGSMWVSWRSIATPKIDGCDLVQEVQAFVTSVAGNGGIVIVYLLRRYATACIIDTYRLCPFHRVLFSSLLPPPSVCSLAEENR